jgi:CAAX protease family protein
MRAIVARVRLALLTLPGEQAWLEFALAAAFFGLCAGAVGFATHLLHFAPRNSGEITRIVAIALIAPALSEELVFRAALIPARAEGGRAFVWIVVSTVLFTLWHVVETSFLPGGAAFFRRMDFLPLPPCWD